MKQPGSGQKSKVLIADGFSDDTMERAVLAETGCELVRAGLSSESPIPEEHRGARAVLTIAYPISDEVMAGLPGLGIIVRYGAGVDSVDLQAASRRGIRVCNVPGANYREVAVHALALLLACGRKFYSAIGSLALGDSDRVRPIQRLSVTTLGIIGFGQIGRYLGQIAAPIFGRILYYDPLIVVERGAGMERAESLHQLLAAADFVSLHCPLSSETERLIDSARLSEMKTGAVLVNTARGGLIDEAALVEALRAGKISAAGLDVLKVEPPPADHPLLQLPNVLYTPHLAWYSEQSLAEIRQRAAREVRRFLNGESLENAIV